MKKILILVLSIFSITQFINANDSFVAIENVYNSNNIDNGWYKATVRYENIATNIRSTYSLNVKVEYNRVVEIDFGNGGSVHTGYNNSGYTYIGGSLSFNKDYDGNITSATTTVTISDPDGMKYYRILIE